MIKPISHYFIPSIFNHGSKNYQEMNIEDLIEDFNKVCYNNGLRRVSVSNQWADWFDDDELIDVELDVEDFDYDGMSYTGKFVITWQKEDLECYNFSFEGESDDSDSEFLKWPNK